MPRLGDRNRTAPLCPGHKGQKPCSDGGVCATRPNGRHRSHCSFHFPFIATEKRLRAQIQKFYDASGVDLSNQRCVDAKKTPPARRQLQRPVRPRDPGPDYAALQLQVDNLTHKLADTRADYERMKAAKRAAERKVRRQSLSFEMELDSERLKERDREEARAREREGEREREEARAREREEEKQREIEIEQERARWREREREREQEQSELAIQQRMLERAEGRLNRHQVYIATLRKNIRTIKNTSATMKKTITSKPRWRAPVREPRDSSRSRAKV